MKLNIFFLGFARLQHCSFSSRIRLSAGKESGPWASERTRITGFFLFKINFNQLLQKSPKPTGTGRGRGRPPKAGGSTTAKAAVKKGTGKRGRPAAAKKASADQQATSASEESSGEQSDNGIWLKF